MLVLGAAGGVGVAAVQISKVLGAKVVAVARGAEKAKLLRDLGADAVIDTSANHQGGGAGPSRQADPSEEGYGALGGPGAQQGPALRDLIKKVAPEGTSLLLNLMHPLESSHTGKRVMLMGCWRSVPQLRHDTDHFIKWAEW